MKIGKTMLAVAALLGGGAAASAQPARQSAAAFARSLYNGTSWRNLLTSDTLRLRRSMEAHTRGEEPDYLDADPVCTCQDDPGFNILSVRTRPVRGGLTEAAVRFEFVSDRPIPARTVRLLLAPSGRNWRIQDITYPYGRRTVSYRWALRQNGAR